jgi:hypothetical protein
MNFSASEDGGVHELTQKMGQGFAVFRGEVRRSMVIDC